MLLEVLRSPVTPIGLHYLLTHYDIPLLDPADWRLRVEGAVARPLTLSLADLRALPTVTTAVTMECAGNGRAMLEPRPASQPWLLEAAGVDDPAVEVVFTGADRGIEGGVEQA
jgi:DMSO/TMAO reductase YedYZ molybdopterin-dependent catalytic subunit